MATDTYSLQKKSYPSLNVIRIIAIAAVIMIHTSSRFVAGYEIGTSDFIWGNIFDSISRLGVPLFVMTSGVLMLDEDKPLSTRKLYSKKILQTLILLFLWSAIYAVRYRIMVPISEGKDFDFKVFHDSFLLGHYHLWYLYMQIGLYLALPILRALVCKKNKKYVLLYIALTLLVQFTLPVIRSASIYWEDAALLTKLIPKFELGFFNIYIAYYLTGWYIVHVGISKKLKKFAIYGLAVISVVSIILYVNATKEYKNAYEYSNLFVYLYSLGVFLAFNSLKMRPKPKSVTALLSKCSFGMYVIHIIVLEYVNDTLPQTMDAPIYILACFALTFFISFLCTYILSFIPLIKKLVRG